MKSVMWFLVFTFIWMFNSPQLFAGNCDYSWQYDSAGRRCGGKQDIQSSTVSRLNRVLKINPIVLLEKIKCPP